MEKKGRKASTQRKGKGSFWREKSMKQLAKEQGIKKFTKKDKRLRAGRKLWGSDKALDDFLEVIKRDKK